MKSKNRTATPVVENGIFTDELPPADVGQFQTEEDFFNQARRGLDAFRQGKRLQPLVTVSFDSVEALLSVLTPKRYELIKLIKEHGSFNSIEELANSLHRDRGTVSRDVKALAEAGLIRIHEAILSGHGRRSEISPVAHHLKLELTL